MFDVSCQYFSFFIQINVSIKETSQLAACSHDSVSLILGMSLVSADI